MTETIIQGSFKPRHNWWRTKQFRIAAGVVIVLGIAGGLGGWQWHRHQQSKELAAKIAKIEKSLDHPVYPAITQQQIDEAHETVALGGLVQSFDGTTMKFLANGLDQPVTLTVTSATTYTKGATYATATASGLKAGTHANLSYNSKTNHVLTVAYDL